MTRLNSMAPNLVPLVNQASDEERHSVKLAACLFVIPFLTAVDRNLLKEVTQLLITGKLGSESLLERLETLAWTFDEKYLLLKDRSDYVDYFIHARGLTGLALALKTDSVESVFDCVYEIAHATDFNKPLFLKFIQDVLD